MTSKSTALSSPTHTHSVTLTWKHTGRPYAVHAASAFGPGRLSGPCEATNPASPGLLIFGLLVEVRARTIIAVQICTANAIGNGIIPASLMGPAVDAASANQRPRLGPFCAVIFAQGCGISLATYTRLEPCCARVQTVYEILFTCDAFQGLVLKRHRSLATKIYSFLVIKITSSLPKDL